MRILILAPKIPWPATDGGRIAIYEPMRRMAARGHQVAFLGFGTEEAAEEMTTRAGLTWARGIPHDTRTNLPRALLSLLTSMPYTATKYKSSAMVSAIREAFQAERFDLVQCEGTHMAHYLSTVQRAGVPSVLRLHNVESHLVRRYAGTLMPPMRWVLLDQAHRMRRFESAACEQANLCVSITEEDAVRVRALAPNAQVAVSPAGVDLERFYPRPMSEEPGTVVFVGALDWLPNVDSVRWFRRKIWPLIRREETDARWIVVGKTPPGDILHWPEDDRSIQVTGFVEDIRPYLNSAAVVVVPLRSGGGMRLKILEAMASGKAVVSTPVGAEGISATQRQEIVCATTEAEFAGAVVQLLRNPADRKRIGKAARAWVEPFGWDRLAGALEDEYRRLLEERNR